MGGRSGGRKQSTSVDGHLGSFYNRDVTPSLELVDPNELPRYTIPEAAFYLRMSQNTLKSWVAGRFYPVSGGERHWDSLIQCPSESDSKLSFFNLAEAHVLLAIRRQYRVQMREVRIALEYAREALGIQRILLSPALQVMEGNLFLQRLNELIHVVGKGGQGAMPAILGWYLERIDRDVAGLPARVFPLTRTDQRRSPKIITIDPRIAFGRPVVARKAIRISTITERFKVGESIGDLAEDYDLRVFEVEEAIRCGNLPDAD